MIHDDLLELADHLARRDPARPKQISLRRAVATAYYAVFHALATMCAEELVGWSAPWEHFTPIYRALDHSRAKRLLGRRETLDLIDRARQAVQATRTIPAQERRLLAVHLITRPR